MSSCDTCLVRNRAICAVLDPTELDQLNRIGRRKKVRRGETVIWEGDDAPIVANVIDGMLKLTTATGDGRELAGFVKQLGLRQEKTRGAGLFSMRSWGKITGVLRLDHPPVIQKELANEQLMVFMELCNPRGGFSVSSQTMAIMEAMQ